MKKKSSLKNLTVINLNVWTDELDWLLTDISMEARFIYRVLTLLEWGEDIDILGLCNDIHITKAQLNKTLNELAENDYVYRTTIEGRYYVVLGSETHSAHAAYLRFKSTFDDIPQ